MATHLCRQYEAPRRTLLPGQRPLVTQFAPPGFDSALEMPVPVIDESRGQPSLDKIACPRQLAVKADAARHRGHLNSRTSPLRNGFSRLAGWIGSFTVCPSKSKLAR